MLKITHFCSLMYKWVDTNGLSLNDSKYKQVTKTFMILDVGIGEKRKETRFLI